MAMLLQEPFLPLLQLLLALLVLRLCPLRMPASCSAVDNSPRRPGPDYSEDSRLEAVDNSPRRPGPDYSEDLRFEVVDN
jgi:hypothetical protein